MKNGFGFHLPLNKGSEKRGEKGSFTAGRQIA